MWALVGVLVIVLVAGKLSARRQSTAAMQLPADAFVPEFSLVDQNAEKFTNASMAGKVWVVDFVFTHCQGPCPMMTAKMVGLSKQIMDPGVKFLSFSVDPMNDTPSVLKQYAKDMGADETRWSFLTGSEKVIDGVAARMKIGVMPASGNAPVTHGTWFTVVGPDGKVRGYYRQDDAESLKQLVADVKAASKRPGLDVHNFPAINATLNGASTVLLMVGYLLIKMRKVRPHAYFMLAACATSAAFLTCYLIYHAVAGEKSSGLPAGTLRSIYLYVLLFPHLVLAVVMVPMIIVTLLRAYQRKWAKHRRIAGPTFWIWLYVSVTGVIIYWMLYHLFPLLT